MSKAVSWNRTGSGFDAREAAREAARRQGKSLGEWLHGVIADNAENAPQRGGDASAHGRIEALTARLERMGAPAPRRQQMASERAPRTTRAADLRVRPQPLDDTDDRDADDPHSAIEQALTTMERRSSRSERRTDEALASVAELIQTNERRRERERAGVESLAEKLADIEARLSARDETPIKGTLARLEARLEQIGRRGEAESSARALVAAQMAAQVAAESAAKSAEPIEKPHADGEPIRRLEEKLNAVLDALASSRAPAPISPPALEAPQLESQDEPPLRRRRLGDAIAEIADRQRSLEAARAPRRAAGGPLAGRVDDIARAMAAPRATARDAMDAGPNGAAIGALRAEMRTMGERIREIAAPTPAPDLTMLESLVRDLGLRIEAVQAPGANAAALDALQDQIGTLATRLERTETGLSSLGSLDRSMRELFAHLEETRDHAETAAAHAATEAVRAAVTERGFDRPAPRADIAVLKAMQEDADLRTRATLDVVHEALEKVVDRLAVVEHGLAEARVARATRDEATPRLRRPEPEAPRAVGSLELGAAEPLVEPSRAPRPRRPAAADTGANPSEFIAAARRAAHAAQTDPSVVAIRRPPLAADIADAPRARATLASKSKDYVAGHKRPVLMALAAVLVVAGTAALMQRLPSGAEGPEVAEAPAPSRVSAYTAPRATRPAPRDDAMDAQPAPRARPALAARIPGSDPVVTGSIPSLPAFAARSPGAAPMAAAARPVAPALPASLAEAAEAGDAAAQYTLATAYAEGRAVPRDFARAAKLYARAADKGIVPAQYRLGALYEKGLGVAQDKARARSLYLQAADAGSPRAMHNLAVLLADGDGKPDYEGAATWFRRAAQLGVHDSQFNLAILLARGLGAAPSLVQSYQWFAIAAAQGDTDAAGKRDEVATKLSASELSVAQALAAAFHPREADPAAVDVTPPPGGWDGARAPLHLNSARSKISSL